MTLVDTHTHLDFTDDPRAWINRAKEVGINKIICVGTSIDASKNCIEVAQKYSSSDLQIFATAGIHAQDGKGDVEKFGDRYIDELKRVAKSSEKVVAIGECGYDFYAETGDEEKEFQKNLFEVQIVLASELKLPLVIHCRNAFDETFQLISKLHTPNSKLTGVFHSWTGDWEAAKKALDLGFYISFSGIVTFKNAPQVLEVAKKMPIDRMLLETDSPFLSPEPLRGEKNEPKNVKITAEFISSACNVPFQKIAEVTSHNAADLFRMSENVRE